jgi:hypothetical protein
MQPVKAARCWRCWLCLSAWRRPAATNEPSSDDWLRHGFPSGRPWRTTISTSPSGFPSQQSCGYSTAASSSGTVARCSLDRQELGNLNQRSTPLVTQECEGQVAVTDPAHPLFGREFQLLGIARLPGHVRHCQVEILPGQCGFIPVASTSLSTELRPEPTILTLISLENLVATFQGLLKSRRGADAAKRKTGRVGATVSERTDRRRRRHRSNSHGGDGT